MPKKTNYKIVPTRLNEDEQEILNNCGYNSHEIMKMFFDEYTSTTPVGLAIKLKLLEKKKKELLEQEIALDTKINKIKKQLSNYDNIDLLPDSIIKLIEIVISNYQRKSVGYSNFKEFLNDIKNKSLIDEHSHKIGYTSENYKKIISEYYIKNY